jgi:hypothetical protein
MIDNVKSGITTVAAAMQTGMKLQSSSAKLETDIMTNAKSTKLNIREDRPTALSSSAHGSNLNAVGFNLNFLASRNPKLAVEILKLYIEAHAVQDNDPKAIEEDFALFDEALTTLLTDNPEDDI